jgi:hypothetical protein
VMVRVTSCTATRFSIRQVGMDDVFNKCIQHVGPTPHPAEGAHTVIRVEHCMRLLKMSDAQSSAS